MDCPVCHEEQIIVEVGGVELDMCLDGHGTWFDGQELRQLFEHVGAPELLQGLEQELRPHRDDSLPRRRCPRCHRRMEHVTAPADPEPVVLDRCPQGDGLWFDHGELQSVLRAQVQDEDPALLKLQAYLLDFDRSNAPEGEGEGR